MLDLERSEQICRLINGEIYFFDYYGLINYNIDIIDGMIYVFVFDVEGNVVFLIILINKQ